MFHEYKNEIVQLKQENAYFHKLFERHNALDEEISQLEKDFADQYIIESKKKEKLKLKDQVYSLIIDFKNGR